MGEKGIKHKDVGAECSYDEFHAEDLHELDHGTSFPANPVERQRFYRDDEHTWYQYNGEYWLRIIPKEIFSISDELQHSDDTEAYETSTTPVKHQEITITDKIPKARIKLDLRATGSAGGQNARARIYKNGVAIGTTRDTLNQSYTTYSEDFENLNLVPGDKIQLYSWCNDGSHGAYTRYLRIYYTITWECHE